MLRALAEKQKEERPGCVDRSMTHRPSEHPNKNVHMKQQISDTNCAVNRSTSMPKPTAFDSMSYTSPTHQVGVFFRMCLGKHFECCDTILSGKGNYEFFPNYSTKHYTRGEKRERGGGQTNMEKKLIHICMLTFLRNPAVISKWIIN